MPSSSSALLLLKRPPASLAAGLTQVAGVALIYFLGARLGLTYAVVEGVVSLVWPPSGIALVAMLHFGRGVWPGVVAGSLLANLSGGTPFTVAALIAAGATLEALAGLHLLRRRADFHPSLDRRRDVLALLVFAALAAPLVSAFVGVGALLAGALIPFAEAPATWLRWWLGDMMGVLVVAPPLLVVLSHRRPTLPLAKLGEMLALAVSIGAIGSLIFGAAELAGHGYYPASLAMFPFLIWAALRFDHWGASMATLAVSIIAIWGTSAGTGPFAAASAVDSLLRWCTYINVFAMTGLLLAASHAEAQRALAALLESHQELENRVSARTAQLQRINADLQAEMTQRRLLERRLTALDDEQKRTIGRELHDSLGQQLTSIALHGASLQHSLRADARPEADNAGRLVQLVREAIEMTRCIARGLHPAALESGGLAAALHELVQNTRTLGGVSCELHVAPGTRIDDPVAALNLYRIAQEALNNALKYSRARRVWIALEAHADVQQLSIGDDGIGFDPARAANNPGLGLHNLRHRATLLGGTLSIAPNAQGGTTVAVRYRLPPAHGEAE